MIVEMIRGADKEEVDGVVQRAQSLGLNVQLNLGTDKTVIAILGSNTGQLSTDFFAVLPGVESVTRIMKPYKIASREFRADDSVVSVSGIEIGGKVLFYPDFALRTAGGDVSVAAPWKSYVLQDRELISGQNPFSDEALLKLLVPALNGKKK